MGIFNDAPTPNYDDPATSGSPLGSLIASIVFGALATCAVAARLWARFGILHRAGVDDLLIVLALLVSIGLNVSTGLGSQRYNWGKHVWDIPPEELWKTVYSSYTSHHIYFSAIYLIKMSILVFYRQLLHGSHYGSLFRCKYVNYGLMAIVTSLYIAFSFRLIFSCQPFDSYWLRFKAGYDREFSCDETIPVVVAAAYCSLATDIAILLFPIVFIRWIEVSRRERWALRGVFCICGITIIAAIIRTVFVTLALPVEDITYLGLYGNLFATIEAYTGIVCASAPALKPFFSTYFGSSRLRELGSGSGPSTTGGSSRARKWSFWPMGRTMAMTTMDSNYYDKSAVGTHSCSKDRGGENLSSKSDMDIELLGAAAGTRGAHEGRIFTEEIDDANLSASERARGGGGVTKRVDVEVNYLPQPRADDYSHRVYFEGI